VAAKAIPPGIPSADASSHAAAPRANTAREDNRTPTFTGVSGFMIGLPQSGQPGTLDY